MTLRKLGVLCVLAGAQTIWAQTWTITKVVDNTTPCPGGTGTFNTDGTFPAIDGPWVVFVDNGDDNCAANNDQSLWSYNLTTGNLVKLADTSTPVPAPRGAGNFEAFAEFAGDTDNLQVHDGTVLFYAYDADSNPTTGCYGGLYTVPAAGGTIHRVVDYTMTLPGQGGSFCFLNDSFGINGLLGMSIDQGKVYFSAQANPGANVGVWWAPANVNTTEADIHLVADGSTVYESDIPTGCTGISCYTVYQWGSGFVGGSNVAFVGGGWPFGGLFLNSYKTPILLSPTVLPGDLNTNPAYPYSNTEFMQPVVDGNDIFFTANDPDYTGTCGGGAFYGVFKTSLSGAGVTSLMNTCDTQPNGDTLNGQNSFWQMAANEGTAVFSVSDTTLGYVLDSSVNGVLSKLIAPGDPLPTGASCNGTAGTTGCVYQVSPPGTNAVNGGRVTFGAVGGAYWYDVGIYVASLPCAANVTSDVSVDLGPLTYDSTTKIWSQTATVTNSSKKGIGGPLSLVTADLTSGVTLYDGSGSTVCFDPAGSSYINLNLPASNRLAPGSSTKATLEFTDPSDAPISFTSLVAGAGAR